MIVDIHGSFLDWGLGVAGHDYSVSLAVPPVWLAFGPLAAWPLARRSQCRNVSPEFEVFPVAWGGEVMGDETARWARFEELRPDQLQEIVDQSPVVYWPLGLIEHHGWHLPVGLDGLIAQAICVRLAKRTGGLVLPVMWWGGGGGHEKFMWTFYQPMDAAGAIFGNTVEKLIDFGFRCIVPLPGHGPWHWIFQETLPAIAAGHPDVLIVGAPGVPTRPVRARPGGGQGARHAARGETSYGLALFPELVDMDALERDRDEARVWPPAGPPPEGERHPDVNFDASSPTFSQAGEDARKANADEIEPRIRATVDHIAGLVAEHLADDR